MWQNIRNFLVSEDGPTAVEYAVMLAAILVAAIATISAIGVTTDSSFSDTNNMFP